METNIYASGYILHPNQKEVEDLVNQVASNYFVPLAQIPYNASEPEIAGQWINANLLNSYDDEPKEKTSAKISASPQRMKMDSPVYTVSTADEEGRYTMVP